MTQYEDEEDYDEQQYSVMTALDASTLQDDSRDPADFYCLECTNDKSYQVSVAECCKMDSLVHRNSWHHARSDMEENVLAFNLGDHHSILFQPFMVTPTTVL